MSHAEGTGLVMATVLGTLGFVMGLLAIWLAAEALRRVDGKNGEIAQPQLREFKAQSARMSAMINALETRLRKLEGRVRLIDETNVSKSNANLANPAGPYHPRLDVPFAPSRSYDA